MRQAPSQLARPSKDQSRLEGLVMGAILPSVRWATTPEISPGRAKGFRIVEVEADSANFEIDRTFGLEPFLSVLPIFGPHDSASVPGLRIGVSDRGGITIFGEDLDASIRISNVTFQEMHHVALKRLGTGPAKNLMALASSTSSTSRRRNAPIGWEATALISLATRSLSAAMPEVGGDSRMWAYPSKANEIAVEVDLATDYLTVNEIVSRISSSLEGDPLPLLSHPRLRPPAHFPLSTGSGIIDLRLVPARAPQSVDDLSSSSLRTGESNP